MRQADYIYGIVPERCEYGFEVQPEHGDSAVLTRVQSLASSFQWTATTSDDVVAISVDRSHPPLVARIATDPRDPDGRLSLCMHIWVTSVREPLQKVVAEVWPLSILLPITQDEFLNLAEEKSTGRIVAGPSGSFSAVGFDQTWGMQTMTPRSSTARPNARPTLATANRTASAPRHSSMVLKAFATILAMALLATGGFALTQYWENEELRASTTSLTEGKVDAEKAAGLLQQRIDEEAKVSQRKTIEIESKTRELTQLRSETQRLKSRIGELESVVALSPAKVDQAELLALRSFKDAVKKYIDSQSRSLKELGDAVPDSQTKLEELADKVKEAIQGKSNNE